MSHPHPRQALDQLARVAGEAEDRILYGLLDGARNDLIHPELLASDQWSSCLYEGNLPPELEAAAPWMVELNPGSAFAEWLLEKGWGDSWGVFLVTTAKRKALRKHLRQFLMVEHDGKSVYFRYYDPRVLRVFLPTCEPKELDLFFGPIDAFYLEDKDAKVMLSFRREEGKLVQEPIDLSAPASAPQEVQ